MFRVRFVVAKNSGMAHGLDQRRRSPGGARHKLLLPHPARDRFVCSDNGYTPAPQGQFMDGAHAEASQGSNVRKHWRDQRTGEGSMAPRAADFGEMEQRWRIASE